MIVNGLVGPTVWQQSVTIQPNTTYYFSAWALSMNNAAPFAHHSLGEWFADRASAVLTPE